MLFFRLKIFHEKGKKITDIQKKKKKNFKLEKN